MGPLGDLMRKQNLLIMSSLILFPKYLNKLYVTNSAVFLTPLHFLSVILCVKENNIYIFVFEFVQEVVPRVFPSAR